MHGDINGVDHRMEGVEGPTGHQTKTQPVVDVNVYTCSLMYRIGESCTYMIDSKQAEQIQIAVVTKI